MVDWPILKKLIERSRRKFRSARLYVAKQLRFVASDGSPQNRKKPDSDREKFCNKTVRRCKKSDGSCWMKNLQAIEGGKTAL